MHQVSFSAFAQRLVCPPPPASANGSVRSLAAPAEPGVGVDTSRFAAQLQTENLAKLRELLGNSKASRRLPELRYYAGRVIAFGCVRVA